MSTIDELYTQLLTFMPQDRVTRDEAIRNSYAADISSAPGTAGLPPIVVLPENTGEVREILKACNAHRVPVVAMGRGSNIAGIAVPHRNEVMVDMRLMNRIIEINEDSVFARRSGGTPQEMDEALRIVGYLLMHTRQLDMIMHNRPLVERYRTRIDGEIKKVLAETTSPVPPSAA